MDWCLPVSPKFPQSTTWAVASAINLTERTVRKIITELEAEKCIERQRMGRNNVYHINSHNELRHETTRFCPCSPDYVDYTFRQNVSLLHNRTSCYSYSLTNITSIQYNSYNTHTGELFLLTSIDKIIKEFIIIAPDIKVD